MIEFNLKLKTWQFALIIVVICSIVFFSIFWNAKKEWKQSLEQQKFKDKIQEAKQKTDTAVIEYRTRVEKTNNIVEKWNNPPVQYVRDTTWLECQADINYLDTTRKKCDTALNNCLNKANIQGDYIKWLESKKKSKIGIGATIGPGLQIAPNGNTSFGLQLTGGITIK